MSIRKAINIQWDFDDGEEVSLPSEIDIPGEVDEYDVSDYLTELTGFCHKGFEIVCGHDDT